RGCTVAAGGAFPAGFIRAIRHLRRLRWQLHSKERAVLDVRVSSRQAVIGRPKEDVDHCPAAIVSQILQSAIYLAGRPVTRHHQLAGVAAIVNWPLML